MTVGGYWVSGEQSSSQLELKLITVSNLIDFCQTLLIDCLTE